MRNRLGHPEDNGAHERMHCDMRFELEDCYETTLSAQQRACDEWMTTFNHVRPHEALGQRLPAEVYRVSPRRPPVGQRVVGGVPDGCTYVKVMPQGASRFEGTRAYLSKGLAGWMVGLQRLDVERVRVWFFHVPLGEYRPGQDSTVQPLANSDVRAEPIPGAR